MTRLSDAEFARLTGAPPRRKQASSQLDALWQQALRVYGADLPPATPEYRFHPVRKWRFDYAWPAQRVALELDGGQWAARGGRHNTDGDREKLNAAAACGWRVVRFSRTMLDDPAACVAIVRAAVEYKQNG